MSSIVSNKLRISGIVSESIVDGRGLRLAVFTQGCPHGCEGCHNPSSHDFCGGIEMSADEIIAQFRPSLDGLSLSGGEPFCQPEPLCRICEAAHERGMDVWAWSGWTYEQLLELPDPAAQRLLDLCDVLVDGRFELDNRTLDLPWRGSRNQRVIDLKKTRECGKIVLYSPPSFIDFEVPRMF